MRPTHSLAFTTITTIAFNNNKKKIGQINNTQTLIEPQIVIKSHEFETVMGGAVFGEGIALRKRF